MIISPPHTYVDHSVFSVRGHIYVVTDSELSKH